MSATTSAAPRSSLLHDRLLTFEANVMCLCLTVRNSSFVASPRTKSPDPGYSARRLTLYLLEGRKFRSVRAGTCQPLAPAASHAPYGYAAGPRRNGSPLRRQDTRARWSAAFASA